MTRLVIHLNVGEDYIEELKERLEKLGISHGALARESGISPTQLSRNFNRKMTPRYDNIVKIETAIAVLRERMEKERRRERRRKSK